MYLTLFLTFLKIGVGTIGGGYAMLPLIQREVVDRGWLSKEDFIDLFSVAQSLPGIFAVNISIFVGYKLKKSMGSVVCALGTILPSFLIILLIAVPCITTARSIKLSYLTMLIPVAAALLIWIGGVSPVWIILIAIAGGLIYGLKIKKN